MYGIPQECKERTIRSLIKELSERVNDLYQENRILNDQIVHYKCAEKNLKAFYDEERKNVEIAKDRANKAMNDQGKTIMAMMCMGVLMAVVVGLSVYFAW